MTTGKKALIAFLAIFSHSVSAQLVITSGAQFSMTGGAVLTLQNVDLIDNGNFNAGNGTIVFTGDASSAISGNQPIQFHSITVNKTSASSVLLQRAISILQQANFADGFIDLNGFDIDLGTTGSLNGETESSRIIGTTGGQVLFNTVLNNPSNANPGGLGAIITSSQNLGNTIIKRGHTSQQNSFGIGSSIFRYYDITPANNTGLNATLQFNYFDGELNGQSENELVFWNSTDNIHWANQGFTARDQANNYTQKTSIPSFSRWTLSSMGNALPVRFTLFNLRCKEDEIEVNWQTAQELNSNHFSIERSNDGIRWSVIGNLPAAGNSNNERSYTFTDHNPVQYSFYRIAQYDNDGRVQYTSVLKSSCNLTDTFNLWPNPSSDIVFINVLTERESDIIVSIFDSKGSLVRKQVAAILQGSNQVSIDIKGLAKGVYQFSAEWNNGQMKRVMQVVVR